MSRSKRSARGQFLGQAQVSPSRLQSLYELAAAGEEDSATGVDQRMVGVLCLWADGRSGPGFPQKERHLGVVEHAQSDPGIEVA